MSKKSERVLQVRHTQFFPLDPAQLRLSWCASVGPLGIRYTPPPIGSLGLAVYDRVCTPGRCVQPSSAGCKQTHLQLAQVHGDPVFLDKRCRGQGGATTCTNVLVKDLVQPDMTAMLEAGAARCFDVLDQAVQNHRPPGLVGTTGTVGMTLCGMWARHTACAAAVAGDACVEVLALALIGAVRAPQVGNPTRFMRLQWQSADCWLHSADLWDPKLAQVTAGVLLLQRTVVLKVMGAALASGAVGPPLTGACQQALSSALHAWLQNTRRDVAAKELVFVLMQHCGPGAWWPSHSAVRRLLVAHLGFVLGVSDVFSKTPEQQPSLAIRRAIEDACLVNSASGSATWDRCPHCLPPSGSVTVAALET